VASFKNALGDTSFGILLALPAIVVIMFIIVFPLAYSIYLTVVPLNLLEPSSRRVFVGLRSFLNVLHNREFFEALLNTFRFVGMTISLELLIGFCIALMLMEEHIRGKGVFKALFTLPLMVAPLVVGLQWRWILADQYGILNYMLHWLHIPAPLWLVNPSSAMWSVVIANLWVATPFVMLVLLAGLQSIPDEPIESSIIDGANWFQRMRYVVLPLLSNTIVVILLIRIADAMRVFDIVYILTGGGPGNSTEVISTFVFTISFEYLKLSEGAAASFILVAIMALISLVLIRISARRK